MSKIIVTKDNLVKIDNKSGDYALSFAYADGAQYVTRKGRPVSWLNVVPDNKNFPFACLILGDERVSILNRHGHVADGSGLQSDRDVFIALEDIAQPKNHENVERQFLTVTNNNNLYSLPFDFWHDGEFYDAETTRFFKFVMRRINDGVLEAQLDTGQFFRAEALCERFRVVVEGKADKNIKQIKTNLCGHDEKHNLDDFDPGIVDDNSDIRFNTWYDKKRLSEIGKHSSVTLILKNISYSGCYSMAVVLDGRNDIVHTIPGMNQTNSFNEFMVIETRDF